MIGAARWQDNWRVVGPPGAIRIDLGRSRSSRRAALRTVMNLPRGAAVVLCAPAPGSARRCRAFAAHAGLELEREYLAFPSASAPAYLVEAAPPAVRVFAQTVLVAPPGVRFSGPAAAALALVRALDPWRLLRALAPGRVVLGRRR